MAMQEWVKLPSAWIEDRGLTPLRWIEGQGSDNTAALMVLIALAHHADQTTGAVRLTYDDLGTSTGLSRAKLSSGLRVLEDINVLTRDERRSSYRLSSFDPTSGWAKLPARSLYNGGRIAAFDDFRLRRPAELHAMKLYLLFAARRGRDTNMANIGYEKIAFYTAVAQHHIKSALNILILNNLVHIEHIPSEINRHGVSNAYRLVGLEPHVHMGTRGRGMDLWAEQV